MSIDQPSQAVRRELLEPPEQWLPGSVSRSLGDRRFHVRVGFHAAAARISKEVELSVGAAEASGQWLVIPVAWRATGHEQLFPVLDGKLTVRPEGPQSSSLWVSATYQPPLGALGRELDDVALHNLARASIEGFVEDLASRLSELATTRSA